MTSLEGSSSRGGGSRKTVMRCEPGQSIAKKRKDTFKQSLRWPKVWHWINQRSQREEAKIKTSWYNYN